MLEHGYLFAASLVLVFLIAFVLAAYGRMRTEKRKKHFEDFQKAQTASREDYAKAYKAAREKLGKRLNVIEIIHDLSPYSLGPAGLPSEITFEQAFEVVRQIKAAQNEAVAIVIHTLGGFSFPAEMIAKALAQHKGKKVTYIPYTAMSGGTAIALATEEIIMGSAAALGPIDIQYWGWPVTAYKHLTTVKAPDRVDDHHLMQAFLAGKFEETAIEKAKKRIHRNHGQTVGDELMTSGRFHGDTISREEAKELGIRVADKECDKEVYALVDAKIRMLALDLEQIVRRQLNMQAEQGEEKSQRWRR